MRPQRDELDRIYREVTQLKQYEQYWNTSILNLCNHVDSYSYALKCCSFLRSQDVKHHLLLTSKDHVIYLDCCVNDHVFSYIRGKVVRLKCLRRHGYKFLFASGYTPAEDWRALSNFNYDIKDL